MLAHQDAVFMARAIKLAKKGQFTTDPNPRVGCVLVKQGLILSEGWHARAGQGHAEVEALKKTADADGATAYVTLEPCSHQGKTPPCCEALINAGVKRVVVAMQDPNPLVAGNGLQRLKTAGVSVDCGILEAEARTLNPGFIKRMTTGRPFVRSKLAMSLDGRTAMSSGESKWITSSQARQDVHRLRAASSAVLTGINTVLADDPSINARLDKEFDVVQPLRVVLDSTLKMPVTARMAELPGRTLILTCSADHNKKNRLQKAGFEVYRLAEKCGKVDLHEVMSFLGQQQTNELMVEAGAVLNGKLLLAGLVEEWLVYMAPAIMGEDGRGLFSLPDLKQMADKMDLCIKEARMIGPDLRVKLIQVKQDI